MVCIDYGVNSTGGAIIRGPAPTEWRPAFISIFPAAIQGLGLRTSTISDYEYSLGLDCFYDSLDYCECGLYGVWRSDVDWLVIVQCWRFLAVGLNCSMEARCRILLLLLLISIRLRRYSMYWHTKY